MVCQKITRGKVVSCCRSFFDHLVFEASEHETQENLRDLKW